MTSQRLGLYIIFILMCLRDFNLNTLQQNCDVKALQFGYFLLSYKKKKNLISWLRQLHLFKIFKCKWSFLTASLISAVSFNHYRKFSHCQKWPAHIHLCQMQWNNLNLPTALSLSLSIHPYSDKSTSIPRTHYDQDKVSGGCQGEDQCRLKSIF